MMTATDTRREAREHLAGKWGKAVVITLVYTIVEFVFSLIQNVFENSAVLLIIQIVIALITIPISYGLVVTFMKLKRSEEVGYFEFLTIGLSNFKKAWSVFLNMLLKVIVPVILIIISMVAIGFGIAMTASDGVLESSTSAKNQMEYMQAEDELKLLKSYYTLAELEYEKEPTTANKKALEVAKEEYEDAEIALNEDKLNKESATSNIVSTKKSSSTGGVIVCILGVCILIASLVYGCVKSLAIALSYNIAYDEPNLPSKEVVKKSQEIMKGNKGNLFVLNISFIGWAILTILTFGIGYLWLMPYIMVASICFYEKLINE